MNKPELYNSSIIDELFEEITPEEFDKTAKKMLLAVKIANAIKAKGWKKSDLAKSLSKSPSEITKWLSGTHNFTYDTLCDLERALDINLINIEISKKEIHVVFCHVEVAQKGETVDLFNFSNQFNSIGNYFFTAQGME